MVTNKSLRVDLPEFANTTVYQDSSIAFWLNFAQQTMNADRWGNPAPFESMSVAVTAGGSGYVVGDTITLAGGQFSQRPTVTVSAVGTSGEITGAAAGIYGTGILLPENPVAQLSTTGSGTGAQFDIGWTYQPNTLWDIGAELFAAHNLSLEMRSQREALNGAPPGGMVGPINNRSVDKVSIGYDTSAGIEPEAGHWNLTVYGTRFIRLLRQLGIGGMQIGVPGPSLDPLSSAGAWAGPWPWNVPSMNN